MVAVGLCLASVATQADMAAAKAAYKAGKFKVARAEYQALAEADDATAQYRMGDLLRKGQGGKKDLKRAVDWFRKAALGGNVSAQIRLGESYRTGQGVPKDVKIAVSWYRKAANAGSSWGQLRLGQMYRLGTGVKKDLGGAAKWLSKAAAQGNQRARKELAAINAMPSRQQPSQQALAPRARPVAPKPIPKTASTRTKARKASRLIVKIPFSWRLAGAQVRDSRNANAYLKELKLDVTQEFYIRGKDVGKKEWGRLIVTTEIRRMIGASPFDFLNDTLGAHARNCDYGRGIEAKSSRHAYGLKLVGYYTCTRNRADNRGYLVAAAVIETDKKLYIVERIRRGKPFPGRVIGKAEALYAEWADWLRDIGVGDGKGQRAPERIGSGSGFRVTSDGHLLTNEHVIKVCTDVRVRGVPVEIVARDADLDLAILKGPQDRRVGTFRGKRKVRVGEPVAIAGYPLRGVLGADMNLTTGVVSATTGIGDDKRFLQISAPMQPGNSGGPALDEGGRIIGIAVAVLNTRKFRAQNVNFVVNGGAAQRFLSKNGVTFKTTEGAAKIGNADLADKSRKFTVPVECWR